MSESYFSDQITLDQMRPAARRNHETLKALGLKPNPDYGSGCLHRKILLRKKYLPDRAVDQGQHMVIAELEDNCHQFRVRLYHDGEKVCHVNGEAVRYPNNTCPGSVELLHRLEGVALGDGPARFPKHTNAREFCTHLFDLACLAYTHASRDENTRLYHAIVEDENDDGISHAKAMINERSVIHWPLKNQIVDTKDHFKGVNVHSGFTKWALQHLQGDELEAAIVLAKTNFVAMSRRVDTNYVAGSQLINGIMPPDTCYTYRSPVMETAYHLEGTIRDFSNRPQDMLQFIELID